MNEIIKNIEAAQLKAEVPAFNTGDTVRVHALIKEGNRERVQVFEGTVLKKQGGSNRATFTVRKSSNGVGVEKTWPLHSPHVVKVEVIRRGKVRRAKLNYLRDRVGKAATNAIACTPNEFKCNKIATDAPTHAPEETPRRSGATSGFLNTP